MHFLPHSAILKNSGFYPKIYVLAFTVSSWIYPMDSDPFIAFGKDNFFMKTILR